MANNPVCWCGNTDLQDYSPDYKKCPVCGTLVCHQILEPDLLQVSGDDTGFYGREYWFSHQVEELKNPALPERSRLDLSERAIHWLRTVLNYQLPPAKSLEVGCGHGGFVALLRQIGFDAVGLELSHWVVEYARKVFNIPMLLGPIEQQEIEDSSLDLVILMDVLEHLSDPAATLKKCAKVMKPEGKLVIQTPSFDIAKNYDDLCNENDPFMEMLLPGEHVYLFSRQTTI